MGARVGLLVVAAAAAAPSPSGEKEEEEPVRVEAVGGAGMDAACVCGGEMRCKVLS